MQTDQGTRVWLYWDYYYCCCCCSSSFYYYYCHPDFPPGNSSLDISPRYSPVCASWASQAACLLNYMDVSIVMFAVLLYGHCTMSGVTWNVIVPKSKCLLSDVYSIVVVWQHYCVQLVNVSASQSGEYRCTATNELGSCTDSARLTVTPGMTAASVTNCYCCVWLPLCGIDDIWSVIIVWRIRGKIRLWFRFLRVCLLHIVF